MKHPVEDVTDVADLWRALGRADVALRLPLPAAAQARLEKRLNFWRNVCGCHLGAMLFLVALGVRIPAMLHTPEWNLATLAVEAGIVLGAGIAGKLLAMAGARAVLALEVALLAQRMRRLAPRAVER